MSDTLSVDRFPQNALSYSRCGAIIHMIFE